jgi:hypothetical protein
MPWGGQWTPRFWWPIRSSWHLDDMDIPVTWTDEAQVYLVAAQLVVLIIAALVAWRQVREARRLREEQSRPFVVIELDSPQRPFFDLVVKNLGTSMARNVRFEFDQEPDSTMNHASIDRLKIFKDGIANFPPGKEFRTLFDSAIKRFKAELPDVYSVRVTYEDQEGKRHFDEMMDIDFGLYWNRMSVTRYGVHDIYKQMDSIRGIVSKWGASPGGGILHVTPDDVARRNKEIEEELDNAWWKPSESDLSEDDTPSEKEET